MVACYNACIFCVLRCASNENRNCSWKVGWEVHFNKESEDSKKKLIECEKITLTSSKFQFVFFTCHLNMSYGVSYSGVSYSVLNLT